MDHPQKEIVSSREFEDTLYTSTPLSELESVPVRTVRDYDKEVQDLKRENFSLKLRIYFLEEQHGGSNTHEVRIQSNDVQHLQSEIEQLRRRLYSQSTQSDGLQTVYNFDHEDERRALREELEKVQKENNYLRQSLKKLQSQSDTREKPSASFVGQSIQTTSSSFDSGLDKTSGGLSSISSSNNELQAKLNASKERERRLQEQIDSLRKQLDSLPPQSFESTKTRAELDRARQQIQQYENDIQNYQQRQSKNERVLQRLQTEYEAQISRLVEQQRGRVADTENYQKEQDRTSPDFNIDEYHQAIDNRDRIIQQLEEAIRDMTNRVRTPFTSTTSTRTSIPGWRDERSESLIHEMNTQMQAHLETVEQLRAECDELRQGEKHLRNQIDSLTRLINTPVRNPELPPLPRPLSSTKTNENIENAEQVEALQMAVVRITLQLRNDADNVSDLTGRVSQILQERDDWQYKINQLEEELKERNTRIQQLERRDTDVDVRARREFISQIEKLEANLKNLQEQLNDRDRRISELQKDGDVAQSEMKRNYQTFDRVHVQEKQTLQGQLETAKGHVIDLEQKFSEERRRYSDLQERFENAKQSTENQVELMEREIQQQRKQIEHFHSQAREIEDSFHNERRQLERERDLERDKTVEVQNTLNTVNRRYSDLQVEFERVKDHTTDEVQDLRRENQLIKDRSRNVEDTINELTRRNNELKTQISAYEIHVHDSEDIVKRNQNEITKLQRDMQEWRNKYENIRTEFSNTSADKQHFESEYKTIAQQNTQLKHELDELEVHIRLQIQSEFEEEYRHRRDSEIQNDRRDKDAIRSNLEQLTSEKRRLEDNVQEASTTIERYETDIQNLRQSLRTAEVKNEQVERDIARAYADELKMKAERLQDLENKYRRIEMQSVQSDKTIGDLRHENEQLVQYNEQLQREYEQLKTRQQRDAEDTAQRNLLVIEERIRKENAQTNENKQRLIDELGDQIREKERIIRQLQNDLASFEPKDLRLELEIRIDQLEEEVQRQDDSIKTYTERVREKEQQIDDLRAQVNRVETVNTQTLREEIEIREQRIEEILNDRKFDVSDYQRQINELQTVLRDREHELQNKNDKLRQIEHNSQSQLRELEEYRQKYDVLHINLNIASEENENNIERIRQLEQAQGRNTLSRLESTIEDLTIQLRQQESVIQELRNTIADLKRRPIETPTNIQGDYNRLQSHYEQMKRQYTTEFEKQEQTITILRGKIDEKNDEIRKIQSQRTGDSKKDYTRPSTDTDALLTMEIEKRDKLIVELKQELERMKNAKSPTIRDSSSTIHHARAVTIRPRPQTSNIESMNREELLYELEMARQHNDELVRELTQKSPNITELHNQLIAVRKELARQKYVNQVLWRKLDALIDIYGSNTRAELAIELANYHNELEALKAKKNGSNDAVLNSSPRSSSELNISILNNDVLSTTNIKSTISHWQEKAADLKEQLHRCTRQSRNYYQNAMKYYKLLYDAGLIDSSSTRQRRHSIEDFDRKSSTMLNIIKSNEEVVNYGSVQNVEELQEIVRNQNKYIQQLQIRIRINTPDVFQSSTSEKLSEENKNLNLVLETYKNESLILKNKLTELHKTIESNRVTLKQYENIIKEQQNHIDQIKKRSFQHEQSSKKPHPPVLCEQDQNKTDDLTINFDINIRPIKKISTYKRESGNENVGDYARHSPVQPEYQRQISNRDEQIRQLTKQLNDLRQAYESELDEYRLRLEKARTDSSAKPNDTRQTHLQTDVLKSTTVQLEQAQDQNQRLHNEIKLLQNELSNKKELISHYEKQITLLEKQISSRDPGTGDMSIRASDMSELLAEMRRLRQDLERSTERQNEIQVKLDESIRLTRAPREFRFSGRGVSYPDLRIIDAVGTENYSSIHVTEEKRSRPLGSSTTELETEQRNLEKAYIVGELENHEQLRRIISDIKIQLKAIEAQIKDKLQSRSTSSKGDPSIEWLEHRLNSLTQCLALFERSFQLIESYWRTHLPLKNNYDEHPFYDSHLADEIKELRNSQSRYVQELQTLKEKYKEQSIRLNQTKANHKKSNTDDYLALLLRPTLDVLQKARSNMEHHLKETNNPKNTSINNMKSNH